MKARLVPAIALLASLVLVSCGAERRAAPTPVETPSLATPPAEAASDAPAPSRTWEGATQVGTVVAERPQTARLFELLGIDYCCGGEQTLAQAAEVNELDLLRLIEVLTLVGVDTGTEGTRDWTRAPLGELMDHIVDRYHTRLRRELPRLSGIVATVVRVHQDAHPELVEIGEVYAAMRAAIEPHLEMEETELFPAIRDTASRPVGETKALLLRFRTDHDDVGAAAHKLRELTNGFVPPPDACTLYNQMLQGLRELERDLHAHVHLENSVLLPRAQAALRDA